MANCRDIGCCVCVCVSAFVRVHLHIMYIMQVHTFYEEFPAY